MKLNLRKMCLTLWIKPFRNTTLRRKVSKSLGIAFLKLTRFINVLYIYIYKWGCQISSLNTIMKPCSFYHIVKYHLIALAAMVSLVRIIIVSVMLIHTNI